MISYNWQAVILDVILLIDFLAIALWFSGDFSRRSFVMISAAFALVAASYLMITIGDLLIALGYTVVDTWILERFWRALSWRYGAAIGFSIVAGVLRFGTFNGRSKK